MATLLLLMSSTLYETLGCSHRILTSNNIAYTFSVKRESVIRTKLSVGSWGRWGYPQLPVGSWGEMGVPHPSSSCSLLHYSSFNCLIEWTQLSLALFSVIPIFYSACGWWLCLPSGTDEQHWKTLVFLVSVLFSLS